MLISVTDTKRIELQVNKFDSNELTREHDFHS